MTRRVVITGMGAVTPLGNDLPTYWNGLVEGRSGVGPIDLFDVTQHKVKFGGQVRNFAPEKILDPRTVKRMDRFAQFATVAGLEALKGAGINLVPRTDSKDGGFELDGLDSQRCGVLLGSGIGGIGEYEEQHVRLIKMGPARVSPFVIPKMMVNAASGYLSIYFGLRGVNMAVSTACASAANAIGEAMRNIQYGAADLMVTGGSEAAMTPMGLAGFISARAVSERNDEPTKASRPFDKDRDGFVLAEGAGVLIIEAEEHAKKRGARILAELVGYGATADAYNITAPCPDGSGAANALRLALRNGKCNPEDIDYVNAHGTSTPLGDEAETGALKQVFGPHAYKMAVSSTKSMVGHLLGSSGGVELIACVQSVLTGVVHPTINYETPDPACDLDYVPNRAREMKVRKALSNSFGFGGHNACLIVGEYK